MKALYLARCSSGIFTFHCPSAQSGRQNAWLRLGLMLLFTFCSGCILLAVQVPGAQQLQKHDAVEVLARARTQFAQGNYDNARQDYLKALPSFPHSFDILEDLGYCYYVTGPHGYAEAAKYYERAYRVNPRSSEVAQKLSQCYMDLKMYQKAAAIETKVARLPNAPAEALKKAAEAYDAAGDHTNARQAYIVYLERNPKDPLARCQLARLDGLSKRYDWAAGQYRIVLLSNPNFVPALAGIAQIFSWQSQFDRSLEFYNRALKFEPDNADALSGKAFVLLWLKHYRQAQELFQSLHSRYPQDADAQRGLEEDQRAIVTEAFAAAQKAGNVSELMAYYRQQAAKNPHDTETLKALATFSADIHHCSESIAFGKKAIEVSNGAPAVQLAVARSLRLCRLYLEAVPRYRQYLQSHPRSEVARYELGDTLRRAHRFEESIEVFSQLVRLDTDHVDGQVGLGQSLAATGQYDEALSRFNQVLAKHPGYYDALQGKAYVLLWKGDLEAARSIFEALRERNPQDLQNAHALREIARAEEEAHWKALRPAAGAPPQAWINFYRQRLASYPKDRKALKGLAYEESHLGEQKAAIHDYRHVLEVYPDDRDSKLELAPLLSLNRQYSAAIELYNQALQQDPEDTNAKVGLARAYVWSAQPERALNVYERLLSTDPSNVAYLLAAGQMEIRLKNFDAARKALGSLLAVDPANASARLELARLNTQQGQYDSALKDYDTLLKQHPQDAAALRGKARICFYEGNLTEAHEAAAKAAEKRPDDFSSVFLLASIDHAQHHRRKTLHLLEQADKLSPGNAQVASLRNRVLSESRVTLTTTAAYDREIGPPSQANGRTGLANEDLRTYTYGTTVGINLMPKTDSYISFTSVPTDSPPGPLRDSNGNQIPTGITGATVPYEFLYRQSTRFSRWFTMRGGAGYVRFGPGDMVSIPGQIAPVKAATERPVGLAGVSFGLSKKLTLDLDATTSAITYTPVSTRLGVIEGRLQGRINYFFNSRTQFHLAYWYGHYTSEDYTHTFVVNGVHQSEVQADHDQGHGGSIAFDREILHSQEFSMDAGYEGLIYGFAGQGNKVYLGFFNPSYYQRHEFVPRIYGSLWGPLGYDLSGGIGIQQTGRGGAVTRAWKVSPNLSVRVSRHLRLIFGYTHYTTAQVLGPLRGNEVRFNTEWQY